MAAATTASAAAVGYVVATAAAGVEHVVALAAALVDCRQAGLSPTAGSIASEGGGLFRHDGCVNSMTEMEERSLVARRSEFNGGDGVMGVWLKEA
jgi:hypothetical protein